MEKLYHYLWKYSMVPRQGTLVDGRDVKIVNSGIYNRDSGPDFFNARVCIGRDEWVGNVEIHVRASDWKRHGHHHDPVYDSVVLHVVGVNDSKVCRTNGEMIPQMVLAVSPELLTTYDEMQSGMETIRCEKRLGELSPLDITDWLESLAVERLQAKALRIQRILESNGGDWQHASMVIFARTLGFNLNNDPLEQLARTLPLSVLARHSDNPEQLEALFFGQAGLLEEGSFRTDPYYQMLWREYRFLAHKYSLQPIPAMVWKYARTRPGNFPHRRIAMLAKVCRGGYDMFGKIRERYLDLDAMRNLFRIELDGYWRQHTAFGREGNAPTGLSQSSIDTMIINCTVPLCYAYGRTTGDDKLVDGAIGMIEKLKGENNVIIRKWQSLGFDAENAFRTQALLQLRKEYCDRRRCLQCRFGHKILRQEMHKGRS